MAKDIDVQKKRIGGNFAIAQAVTSEEMRNHIRLVLPDCIFITLTMTKEAMIKRLKARHGENVSKGLLDMMSNLYSMYELPGKKEPNTFNVDITDEMTPKDVMDMVLELLDKGIDEVSIKKETFSSQDVDIEEGLTSIQSRIAFFNQFQNQ